MSKCRSCGQEIRWAVTVEGSRIPLDTIWRTIATKIGDAPDGTPIVKLARGYESHFATCPNAAAHRKTKTKSESVQESVPFESREEREPGSDDMIEG